MDIKFWIWIAIILGSFVVNAMKKRKAAGTSGEPPKSPSGGKRQLSFEELLEEIQSQRKVPKTPPPVTITTADRFPESKAVQPVGYEQDRTNEIYENAKQEAFNRPSLEETMKLQDTVVSFGAFSNYVKPVNNSWASAFASEIRTPSGFKRAFLMSEIMQRKF